MQHSAKLDLSLVWKNQCPEIFNNDTTISEWHWNEGKLCLHGGTENQCWCCWHKKLLRPKVSKTVDTQHPTMNKAVPSHKKGSPFGYHKHHSEGYKNEKSWIGTSATGPVHLTRRFSKSTWTIPCVTQTFARKGNTIHDIWISLCRKSWYSCEDVPHFFLAEVFHVDPDCKLWCCQHKCQNEGDHSIIAVWLVLHMLIMTQWLLQGYCTRLVHKGGCRTGSHPIRSYLINFNLTQFGLIKFKLAKFGLPNSISQNSSPSNVDLPLELKL